MRNQPPEVALASAEALGGGGFAQHADLACDAAAFDEKVAARRAETQQTGQIAVRGRDMDRHGVGLRRGGLEIDIDDRHLELIARADGGNGVVALRMPVAARWLLAEVVVVTQQIIMVQREERPELIDRLAV